MADVGRWGVQDQMAELMISEGPYTYVSNNPLLLSDPTGMLGENANLEFASTFIDFTGKVIEHRDDGDDNVYLVKDPSTWNGSERGLPIVGQEDPAKAYNVGDQYTYYTNKPYSLINYLNNIAATAGEGIAGKRVNAMLESMAVNFVPIWDEAGRTVIGFMPKGTGSFAFKAIRFVKGTFQFLGPLGDVVFTAYNVNQFAEGRMSGAELTYNVTSTGLGLYAGFVYGGPVGLAVGTFFFIGEGLYNSIQELKAMQERNRTPENTMTNWDQLKRKFNDFSNWDFGATRNWRW